MSLEQLGEKSYALRNLWEATLFDEKQNPIDWTTGLMVSTNIPKLRFIVEPILAGSSKGYKGWELPDSLSLAMRETSDHTLEKYLDEWMMGKTGIFNPETGAFRKQSSADFLYRKVRVRTFYYKFTSGEDISVKVHNAVKRGADEYVLQVDNGVKKLTGDGLPVKFREYLQKQAYSVMFKEYAWSNPILFVEEKQYIPVVDKLAALASNVANQAVSKIPASNLTRAILPPLVIPPPLLKVPVPTGFPSPPLWRLLKNSIRLYNPTASAREDIESTDYIRKVTFDVVQETTEEIVAITRGKATDAKKWKAEEVTTALVTYTCAIESYDIGTYDYATGEGVQYTINLPVCDIKIEHKS